MGLGLPTYDPRESASPWSQWEDKDVFGLSGRIDYVLPGGQTLTYLAALRDGDFEGRYSLVGLPSPPSLTDAAPGTRVSLEVGDIDLLANEVSLRYLGPVAVAGSAADS